MAGAAPDSIQASTSSAIDNGSLRSYYGEVCLFVRLLRSCSLAPYQNPALTTLGSIHNITATPKSPIPISPFNPAPTGAVPLLADDAAADADDPAALFALLTAELAALVAELMREDAELNAELLAAPPSVEALLASDDASD